MPRSAAIDTAPDSQDASAAPLPGASFWDGLAEKYAAKPVDDPEAFERKIDITRTHLTETSRVFEIGCGTGSLALRLAEHAGELHGVDVSGEMVRIARDKARDADVSNLHFHRGTLETVDFEPASFDVVMAWSLLHLVPDRAAALRRLFELARPGGTLVASTVVLGQSWVPYSVLLWGMRMVGKAPWVAILTPDQLEAEVRAAGFVDLERHEVGAKGDVHFMTARRPG